VKPLPITREEKRALLAILHGAQDDDAGEDAEYSAALASLLAKTKATPVKPKGRP